MKKFNFEVNVPVEWTFNSSGTILWSTPVGEYIGTISKRVLRVSYVNGGMVRYEKTVKSRKDGMETFNKVVRTLLSKCSSPV